MYNVTAVDDCESTWYSGSWYRYNDILVNVTVYVRWLGIKNCVIGFVTRELRIYYFITYPSWSGEKMRKKSFLFLLVYSSPYFCKLFMNLYVILLF